MDTPPAEVLATEVQDDLEKYLALPVEKNMDLDVLEWWKAKDCAPKDGARRPAGARQDGPPVPRPPGVVGGRRAHALQGGQVLRRRLEGAGGRDTRGDALRRREHRVMSG